MVALNYRLQYIFYRHRYRLLRIYQASILGGVILFLSILLYMTPVVSLISKTLEGANFSLFDIAVGWSERDPRGLIRSAVPIMAWAGGREDYPEELTPGSLVTAMLAPFQVNLFSPWELLASEMPALAEYKRKHTMPAVSGTPLGSPPKPNEMTTSALVGIYHTHTGETYAPTDGTERLPPGQKGGVVEVGRALKETLQNEYGIRVAHDETVNDKTYATSYIESEKSVRRLLEENKDILILIDIHRDAGKPREDSLVQINGQDLAPILFVVGSDARAPFPGWRNNYDFATGLSQSVNKEYPGLCIGVRVKEGRYNQFLHPRALLMEFGSVSNSTGEAMQSARLIAGILAREIATLAPDKYKQTPAGNPVPAGDGKGGNNRREL